MTTLNIDNNSLEMKGLEETFKVTFLPLRDEKIKKQKG